MDLGRVEEIRNGVDVSLKVKDGLDRKYGLVENGKIHGSDANWLGPLKREMLKNSVSSSI